MERKMLILSLILMISNSCDDQYKDLPDGLYADIETNKGHIILQLAYQEAPLTVANFVSLAEGTNDKVSEEYKKKPFYNGLKFHRVVPDFVIQGGDPTGQGNGNPGYRFPDEISELKHDRAGTLSMANSGPNTNGSQIFITHRATPHLDGRHSVFGYVAQGQEVVDSIAQGDLMLKVSIIRKGSLAKKFDAPKVFSDKMEEAQQKELAKIEAGKKLRSELIAEFDSQKQAAETTSTGLKIYWLHKGDGEKPVIGSNVALNYVGYLTDGNIFDTNDLTVAKKYDAVNAMKEQQGGYAPMMQSYSADAGLIPGFKEGMLMMKKGDKVRLFIPSYLAYGPTGAGGVIPPNADLIFDLEIVN